MARHLPVLSKFELFQNSDPETAAALATRYAEILNRPTIRRMLADRGINPSSLLDVPLTSAGIARERAMRNDTGLFAGIQRGAADALDRFGLAGVLQEAITGDEATGVEASPYGSTTDVLGYQIEPSRFLSGVAAGVLPLALAGGIGGAAVKAAGVTNPLAAGSLFYGSTFAATEAAAQLGRAVFDGEDINPAQIVSEGLIGAATGLPLGTGFAGRAKQALAAGAGVAATSLIPGVDFEPGRLGSEALFAALFPAHPMASNIPTTGPISQRELLLREAAKTEAAGLSEVQRVVGGRLGKFTDEQIIEQIKKGTTDDALLESMFPGGAATTLGARWLRARAAAVEELSGLPEDQLRSVMEEGGLQSQAAADALAYKLKATRPVDAPALDPQTPKEVEFGIPTAEDKRAIEAAAQNAALESIRARTLPYRLQHVDVALTNTKQWMDSLDGIDATVDTLTARFGEKVPEKYITPPKDVELRADFNIRARAILFPEYDARLKDIESSLGAIRTKIKELPPDSQAIPALKNSAERLQSERNQTIRQLNDVLNTNVPIFINSAEEAKRVFLDISAGLGPNELTRLRRNLPPSIKKYEKELNNFFNQEVRTRHRKLGALERASINSQRKLYNEGVIKDPINDLTPQDIRNLEGGDTFAGMKRRASAFGGSIRTDGNKFILSMNGQSVRFTNLKSLGEALNRIARDEIGDAISLEQAAAKRMLSVTHTGDGQYRIVDHITGDIKDVANPVEAAAAVKEVEMRVLNAPELNVPTPYELPGVGSGRAYTNNSRTGTVAAYFDELDAPIKKEVKGLPANYDVAVQGLPPRIGKYLTTAKEALLKVQEFNAELPVYTGLFEPMTKVITLRQSYMRPHLNELRKIFKGVKTDRQNAIQEAFLARGDTRELVAQLHNLNGTERKAVESLEKWYGKVFELNEAGVSELQASMGKFRKAADSPSRVLGDHMLPRLFNEIRGGIESGKVRVGGDRADGVAVGILHEIANERFGINKLGKRGEQLLNAIREREKKLGRHTIEYKQLHLSGNILENYLETAIDRSDLAARELKGWAQTALTPMLKKAGKIFGDESRYIKGDVFTEKDLDRLATMFTSWYSGVAMSARPALAIRNMTQSYLAAPKVGFGNVTKTIKDVLSDAYSGNFKMWEEAKASGVIAGGDPIFKLDDLDFVSAGFWRRAMDAGLVPYRKADEFNRVVAYHAGKRAVERWGAKFAKDGDIDSFLLHTGLAGDSSVIQNVVLKKIKGQSLSDAADYYGRHLAQDTQFIYNRANLPDIMTGTTGRLFGQFGVWPVGFWNYMRRNTSGIAGSGLRATYARRFLGKWALLYGGTALGLGGTLGIDTSSWNFGLPFTFEGGPAFQLLRDATNTVGGGSEYQKKLAWGDIRRFLTTVPVPFGGMISDIRQAGGESNALRQALTLMGFNLVPDKKE